MLNDPGLSQAALFLLSRHWRLLMEQIGDLKLRSAEQRLARFLARRVSEESGAGSAALPEQRSAIAARLGMTPETMSRALHALTAKRLIRVTSRRADVIDRDRLLQV
ncbi:Transcription regulator, crp family (plasmid) [Roseomonas mucosa]|uniref:Crp/Fnr family transcriptional regulator n=1 Tax=Roseomonas mucosa TaxID=207340 RepID=UPI0022060340|nr:helix-turn-helix domain-containing protein [Roseomonas mucosa]QDJ11704.1 Transcription regulator, crp family [Roseomonas mucosa]